jgi:hypothetical protein
VIAVGGVQVRVTDVLMTLREVEPVAALKSVVSAGVKLTARLWEPALRREPAAGVYVKAPGTEEPL